MKATFAAACALVLMFAKYAAGQANLADSASLIMDGFDTNKNGKISLKELMAHVGNSPEVQAAFGGWKSGFLQADVDTDGQLDVAELTSLLEKVSKPDQHKLVEESEVSVAQSIMDGFDTNKDGKISLMELLDHVHDNPKAQAAFGGWQAGFKQADVDGDMHLTVKELASLLTHVGRQEQHKLVEDSESSVAASIMDGMDTNKDGKLSSQELFEHVRANPHMKEKEAYAGWEAGFVEADVDKDRHLTVEELASLLARVSRQDQHALVQESEVSVAHSIMDGFDANKDGTITLKELMVHVGGDSEVHAAFKGWKEGFLQADSNKDGRLTVEELASLLNHVSRKDQHKLVEESEESMAWSIMDGFDTNKDGAISLKELMAHIGDKSEVHAAFKGWEAGFLQADADKDGRLNVQELGSLLNHVSRQDQHKLVGESEVSVAGSIMDGFDTNKDGGISLKELLDHVGDNKEVHAAFKGWQAGFIQADVDKDGRLNVHELGSLLNHVSREDQHKLVEESEVSVAGSIMDGFDTNKDGAISLKELLDHVGDSKEVNAAFKGWQAGFLQADANKDGRLNVQELGSLLNQVSRPDQQKLVKDSEVPVAESIMDGFDANKNGKISLKELMAHVGDKSDVQAAFKGWKAGFLEADVDKDGQLSIDELSSLLLRTSRQDQQKLVEDSEASMAKSILAALDTDKDGKLSTQELLVAVRQHPHLTKSLEGWQAGFVQADVDKDRSLTVQELTSLLKHASRKEQHKLVKVSEMTQSILDGYDSNKDGKISLMELLDVVGIKKAADTGYEGWQTGFKSADADKDGFLNAIELESMLAQVTKSRPRHEEI